MNLFRKDKADRQSESRRR